MSETAYVPQKPSRTQMMTVRGLRYRLRTWGDERAPLLLFLHGHRDSAATFQFMIDRLQHDWRIVAPDWRGHGGSDRAQQGYWYHDYLADLDAIVDQVSPDAPVSLIGHSLGGNVGSVFAGLRPQRVTRLVSLDGFGLRNRPAQDAPEHLRGWLDVWKKPLRERPYASRAELAERLMKSNPRLTRDKALYLAQDMGRETEGGYTWTFDPAHRIPFATLHRVDEWAACWRQIEARTLWIVAGDREKRAPRDDEHSLAWRVSQIRNGASVVVPDTGHNIHHDAPEEAAAIIERFLTS